MLGIGLVCMVCQGVVLEADAPWKDSSSECKVPLERQEHGNNFVLFMKRTSWPPVVK